jgi:hypothetical protein
MRTLCKKIFLVLLILLFAQQLFAQAPTITSFSPTTAGPGDTVIIIGTNLTGVEDVSVGGPVGFQIVSSTEIYAFIAVAGSGDVTLNYTDSNFDELSVSLPGFTWDGTPVFYSVAPLIAKQGDTVTINGKHLVMDIFNDPPTITFGGVAAASVKASSSTVVRAVVGSGASGNISLTACCGSATYPGFVYIPSDTWTGSIDSTWENPGNWSTDSLPNSNTAVIINSGNVVLKSNTAIWSLTVSPGANFTVIAGNKLTITH